MLLLLCVHRKKHDIGFSTTHGFRHPLGFFFLTYPRWIRECALSHFSCDQLSVTLWTVAHQGPLSMGFSRQEYWSGLPCPPPGDFPNPGIKPRTSALQADSLLAEPPGKPIWYINFISSSWCMKKWFRKIWCIIILFTYTRERERRAHKWKTNGAKY